MARATSPVGTRGIGSRGIASRGIRAALVVLGGFITVTAMGGGLALAAGLEEGRFPVSLLGGTPFPSYLAPGLILALIVGGSAATATAATLCSERLGPRLSVLAGAILVGWVVGEVLILRAPEARSPIEVMCFGIGALMAGLGVTCCLTERSVPTSVALETPRSRSGRWFSRRSSASRSSE